MISASVTGNLGQDAELTHSEKVGPILKFSVAANTNVSGEKTTTWVRVAVFGKRAEALAEYLTQGKSVTVIGPLSMRTYETKSGETKTALEMVASDIAFMGGKSSDDDSEPAPKKFSKPSNGHTNGEKKFKKSGKGESLPF